MGSNRCCGGSAGPRASPGSMPIASATPSPPGPSPTTRGSAMSNTCSATAPPTWCAATARPMAAPRRPRATPPSRPATACSPPRCPRPDRTRARTEAHAPPPAPQGAASDPAACRQRRQEPPPRCMRDACSCLSSDVGCHCHSMRAVRAARATTASLLGPPRLSAAWGTLARWPRWSRGSRVPTPAGAFHRGFGTAPPLGGSIACPGRSALCTAPSRSLLRCQSDASATMMTDR